MKSLLLALLVILIAGSGAVFFAAGGSDEALLASAPSPLDADYDYYIADMRATRFGGDGQPVSQLKAERVTHYPEGDRAELQAPEFRTFGASRDPWQVTATTGTLAPDAAQATDRLALAGEVLLHKPLDDGNFVDISTSELTVFVDTEEVISSAAVTIQTRDTRLDGVGQRVARR